VIIGAACSNRRGRQTFSSKTVPLGLYLLYLLIAVVAMLLIAPRLA
jgi:hypothetical protein